MVTAGTVVNQFMKLPSMMHVDDRFQMLDRLTRSVPCTLVFMHIIKSSEF